MQLQSRILHLFPLSLALSKFERSAAAEVRPTEQLLTETHPATSGDDARARIANELGAYRIARGLEPEKQRLPKSMPDQSRKTAFGRCLHQPKRLVSCALEACQPV